MFTKFGRTKNKWLTGGAILLIGLAGFLIYRQFNNQPDTLGLKYLEKLLAEQQWKNADIETKTVMLRAVGKKGLLAQDSKNSSQVVIPPPRDESFGDTLVVQDIEFLSCPVLRKIDKLWVKYSKGRFGFSVQKRILEEVKAATTDPENTSNEFGTRLGWISITTKQNITNYFNDVPVGYLPRNVVDAPSGAETQTSYSFRIIRRLTDCEHADL